MLPAGLGSFKRQSGREPIPQRWPLSTSHPTRDGELGAWQPLLSGAMAKTTWDTIREIGEDLAAFELRFRNHPPDSPAVAPLAEGAIGVALFFAYAHEAFPGRGWDEAGLRLVDDAMRIVSADSFGPSLFGGIAGVGWGLRHLEGRLFEADDDPGREVESVLLEMLSRPCKGERAELIYGLAGYGIYLLERLPAESARQGVERVIGLLGENAQKTEDTFTWFIPPSAVPAHQSESTPAGYYNLGVAHGVPGVIGFLAEAHRLGIARDQARDVATGAIRWLLAQRLTDCPEAIFPSWVGPGIEPTPTRLAWCYGDPGIAAILLGAARSFGRDDWEYEALDVARHAARRREPGSGIQDAGLCHGAAGVGHLFNRIFQATGDEAVRQAAVFWLEKCLEKRQPGRGPGGFQSLQLDGAGQQVRKNAHGFLTGAAGIGLALLAAITDIEPLWDRLLLTAIPPRGNNKAH